MADGNAVAVGSDCSEDAMSSDAASFESSATSFSCSAAVCRPDAGWRRDHLYAEDLPESSVAHAYLDGQRGADQRLIDALGTVIDGVVVEQERRMSGVGGTSPQTAPVRLTPFHGLRPPPITITAYLRRILQYSKCSPVCFVMAFTYLERLAEVDPAMVPTPLNVHRLLITGVLLAAKLMDDNYFNNAYYAKIGGVGVAELNRLELEMMRLLEYRLRVPACTIEERVQLLLARAGAKAGREEGSVSGLLQHSTEDAVDAMVESPQSSAAGAGLSRVASQESVAGGSPRGYLPPKAGTRERAAAGGGGSAQGSEHVAGPVLASATAVQTGRPPLSFAAALAKPKPLGGSPPGRSSAGVWQYHQQQQQQQQQSVQQAQQQVAVAVAGGQETPAVPGARQPSWPPMSGALTPAPVPATRSPSVPVTGLSGKAGAPSFAAVVAAPKRGRASVDGAFSGGSRWQAGGTRGERPVRSMAPAVSVAAAAAAHMGGGHVQRVSEGIKAC